MRTEAGDTIAAIATAPGAGGVGIVRLSGPRSRAIAEAICGRRLRAAPRALRALPRRRRRDHRRRHRAVLRRAPRATPAKTWSNCRRTAARSCCEQLLQRCVALGARRARPGEFSERAFLNGKLDLAQAEAVADLIAAGRRARRARRAPRARRRVLASRRRGGRRRCSPCACTSKPRSTSPTSRIDTLGGAQLRARFAQRRATHCDELLRARRARPAPARRPARGDRRPAECRQEFAAQCARRQRSRHRHRHRRHHARPVARSRAHGWRRTHAGRYRGPARRRRCDRARRHAPCAQRTANAPTSPSSCSMRATRTPAAPPSPTRSPACPQRLWLHNKADLLDRRRGRARRRRSTTCACPPAPAPGLDALHARLRALAPARGPRPARATFTARARHVDALRQARRELAAARAPTGSRSPRPGRRSRCARPTTPSAKSPAGSVPTTCSATSSPASASASSARTRVGTASAIAYARTSSQS